MSRDNLLVGLDIGTSKVSLAIGAKVENEVQLLGISAVPHNGLRRGIVTDIDETVTAITHCLEGAERMAGVNVTHATVAIHGSHINSTIAKGMTAPSQNSTISEQEIQRAIDAAKSITLPQNRELIHILPLRFLVDGQDVGREPEGLQGSRLETECLLVTSSAPAVRNITKAVNQAGIEVDNIVLGAASSAKLLTTKKQRDSGVILIDIGAGSTDIAVFEEGLLIHAASIQIGSTHVTHDLAIGLRTNLDVAEEIKNKYGSAIVGNVRDSDTINLSNIDPGESERVSKKQVCEIIEARITEIFQMIKEELQIIDRDGALPAGAIITGGGVNIDGITELSKNILRLPSQIGYPVATISGMVDKIDSPLYAASIGLVLWAAEETNTTSAPWKIDLGKFGGVVDRFRGIFKNFTN